MIFFLGKISGCWSIIIVFHFCPKLILCLCFFQLNTGFVKINSGAKVIGQIYWMLHSAVLKNRENRRKKIGIILDGAFNIYEKTEENCFGKN